MSFITKSFIVAILASLSAVLEGATPNPPLSGLPDNTVFEIGPYTCTPPQGEPLQECRKISDFSGLVYDAKRHRMLMFGGGHATTFTDTIAVFDPATLTWTQLYAPTPCSYLVQSNYDSNRAAWLNGPLGPYPRPISRHTYDELVVVGDELIMLASGSGRGSCAFNKTDGDPLTDGGRIAHYDLINNRWSFSSTAQGDTEPVSFPGTDYDPVSERIIMVGRYGIWIYDPASRTKSLAVDAGLDEMGIEGSLVYYPPNQKLYFFADKYTGIVKVWEITLDRKNFENSTMIKLTTSGKPSSNRRGYAYDSVNQIIGGGIADNKFYAFDPLKRMWSSQTMEGGAPGNASHHAVSYDPVNNVFLFINEFSSFDRRTWAYKYKNDSASLHNTSVSEN
ncbi:MAG: hypothetical protein ACREVE_01545 [Gammaproteobacteria bacterium]